MDRHTTSGQTSTTSGQTSTTGGELSTTSRQTSTTIGKIVLRVTRQGVTQHSEYYLHY